MRVKLKGSILEMVEKKIESIGAENIDFIELTKDEYINLLEELTSSTRIVFGREEYRKINGVQLVVAND